MKEKQVLIESFRCIHLWNPPDFGGWDVAIYPKISSCMHASGTNPVPAVLPLKQHTGDLNGFLIYFLYIDKYNMYM